MRSGIAYLKKVTSTCIRFRDIEDNPDYDYASILARHIDIEFLATTLTAEELISYVDPIVKAMDEPHDTIRQLGLFAAYKTLHDAGCKVVLVGEGSDEFNMGYYHSSPGFHKDKETCKDSESFRAALRAKVPQVSQIFAEEFLASVDIDGIIDSNVTNHYDGCQSEDPMDRMQYFYTKKFLKYRLDANDRCSMAHSIEARVPFCDHNLIRESLRVPNELNLCGGTEKGMLREAFKYMLPREIAQRRKHPLPESDEAKLHRLIADELDKSIESADAQIWRILDKDAVIRLNQRFRKRIEESELRGRASELTEEIPMGETAGVKVKHVFAILTLIRWHQIYFT